MHRLRDMEPWRERATRWRRHPRRPSREGRPEGFTIELDYAVQPRARHGWGRPAHPQLLACIERDRESFGPALETFAEFADDLARIPARTDEPTEPFWNNGWFQGLDIVALYALLAQRNPRRYVEIGSGHSTRVARRAVSDHQLRTTMVAIDPMPRSTIEGLVHEHRPARLEEVDLSIFDSLEEGDLVVFDGSHRAFTNSDVTVFFTEVLPRLRAGVLVQVHDIFLPWDYRPDWADRWYSEQYLLAIWLLAGARVRVVSPNFYVSTDPDLAQLLTPVWDRVSTDGAVNIDCPSAFWFDVREEAPPNAAVPQPRPSG